MISRKQLLYTQGLLHKETETCGILSESNGLYYLDRITEGVKSSCKYPVYSEYIWHTHPIVSKAYIGSHDLIDVLKKHKAKDYPHVSLIFTVWGIWEFYAKNKQDFTERQIETIKKCVNSNMEKVYYSTDKGRGKLSSDSLQLLLEGIKAISMFINSHYKSELTIVFTEWGKILDGYNLFKAI